MVTRSAEAELPTKKGNFRIIIYRSDSENVEHLALIKGGIKVNPLTRLHSECLTGDVFGSLKCDCGSQLNTSLEIISEHGSGVLLGW
jgi:3,4-dihydroxy 2-butanone 4-phosphate synthase / GTP cyclohydrolase II